MSSSSETPSSQTETNARRQRQVGYALAIGSVLAFAGVAYAGWCLGGVVAVFLLQFGPQEPITFGRLLDTHMKRDAFVKAVGLTGAGFIGQAIRDVIGFAPSVIRPAFGPFKGQSRPHVIHELGKCVEAQWKNILQVASIGFSLALATVAFNPSEVVASLASTSQIRVDVAESSFILNASGADGGSQPNSPTGGPPSPAAPRSSVVVLFEEEDPVALESRAFNKGLKFSEPASTQRLLTFYAESLAACSPPGNPATVDIRGFASSSGTPQANLQLAHARAFLVKSFLDDYQQQFVKAKTRASGSASRFGPTGLRTPEWKDFEEMKAARGVEDRLDAVEYSLYRGQLNRRVELTIMFGGDCAR